jgi:hypothetical protein
MKNSAAVIGVALGVALGSFGAAQIGIQANRAETQKLEQCWADGGEYVDGTCGKPEYEMSASEKVCVAMGGSYVTSKRQHAPGVDTKCYRTDGSEITLPDWAGKEVVVLDDGTVVLRSK